MKKIYLFMILSFFCFQAGATTNYASLMRDGNAPEYLAQAANAWATISAIGTGRNAQVADQLNQTSITNIGTFRDLVSAIAFNESPLTIFESRQHIDTALSIVSKPLASRRTVCVWRDDKCDVQRQNFIIDSNMFGGSSEFTSDYNGSFETRRHGVNINVKGYVSEGFTLGLGYTRITMETKDERVYSDATSNSITVFGQYLSQGNIFVNGGLSLGQINWLADKIIIGISDSTSYDTNFFAAQLSGGMKFGGPALFITPQLGLKYMHIKSEKHTDEVVQVFDEWKYNSVTGSASVRFGTEFTSDDFSFTPAVSVGASYGLFGNSDDYIHATLINGSSYNVPIESGAKAAFNAGIGMDMKGLSFGLSLSYKLDVRDEFISHTGTLSLKLSF